jgi:hypothetical protein
MTIAATVLWRRLDTPGHDACRLEQYEGGWRLEGTAVFRHESGAARLTYEARCDAEWRSRSGRVAGWLGPQWVDFNVARTSGDWVINGVAVSLDRCVDLDFGFTPATNLFQLRRLALPIGGFADAPAAWLDPSAGVLVALPQRYERRTDTRYGYHAPSVDYAAELEVDASGFVRRYPGLWEMDGCSTFPTTI